MPKYSKELAIATKALEAATSSVNAHIGHDVTDDSIVLLEFCQSLEEVLRQGLKVGSLCMMGLVDRDYWNCFEGLTTSSRVTVRPPPSINHVITVVKQCKKVFTSKGRGRLFIRAALTKGVLVQGIEALLNNQDYVRYWYRESSHFVDYRRKGIILDILKSLKKKDYKLNFNNCSFLDESWLIPKIETFEFVPCAELGLVLVAESGKAVIVGVMPGSIAQERDIQPGDCLEELNGIVITDKLALRFRQLKRRFQGKPLVLIIVKGRFEDGRWFSPLYVRYQSLCNSGRCRMPAPIETPRENEPKVTTDHQTQPENEPEMVKYQQKVTLKHVFRVDYLGMANVGKNSDISFIQDGIEKLFKSGNIEKIRVKIELMEKDILIHYEHTNKVLGRYSFNEMSGIDIRHNDATVFGFLTRNTTCSLPDSLDCHVFSCESLFVVKNIIDGIGKGFDRFCV